MNELFLVPRELKLTRSFRNVLQSILDSDPSAANKKSKNPLADKIQEQIEKCDGALLLRSNVTIQDHAPEIPDLTTEHFKLLIGDSDDVMRSAQYTSLIAAPVDKILKSIVSSPSKRLAI